MRKKAISTDSSHRMIKIFSSNNARKILEIISTEPYPVKKIHEISKIPINKIYEWIQKFEDEGILEISGDITDEGRKSRLFKSKIKLILLRPSENSSKGIQVIGMGVNQKCQKCGFENYSLTYFEKSDKLSFQCVNCKTLEAQLVKREIKEKDQIIFGLKYMIKSKK